MNGQQRYNTQAIVEAVSTARMIHDRLTLVGLDSAAIFDLLSTLPKDKQQYWIELIAKKITK